MSKGSQKILIPKGLASCVIADKEQRKAVCTWLRLKNATKSGVIPNNTAILLSISGVTRNTLKKRLKYLSKQKLIRITKTRVFICDWDTFGFRIMNEINLKHYYVHTSENLEHVLIRLMIKESLRLQRKQIAKKVKKYGNYATMTAPAEALKNDLVTQFITNEAMQIPKEINPIVTLSQKGIALRMGTNTHGSAGYYMRLFTASGKIKVTPGLLIKSEYRTRKTALGSVKWSPKYKATFVKTCNIIEILPNVVKNLSIP